MISLKAFGSAALLLAVLGLSACESTVATSGKAQGMAEQASAPQEKEGQDKD